MAPRASWKGFLNLSLVSVPVKAYTSSNSGGSIRLNQLHAECNSRIKQKITCPSCGEIPRDEIVKGYEYAKDQYVVIDLDELDKLRAVDDSRAIRIDTFVPPDAIDPIYYTDTVYYLLPDGTPGQKSYALLLKAMTEKELYCVANIVLFNKEQLVLVRPIDNLLSMTILKYSEKVKPASTFDGELVSHDISDAEMKLAETLINESTAEEFDLESYKDQYTDRLQQLIESKVNGEEIVAAPNVETPAVLSLMDALKASVEQAQTSSGSPIDNKAPTAKKVARTKKKGSASKKKSAEKLSDQLASPKKKKDGKKRKSG